MTVRQIDTSTETVALAFLRPYVERRAPPIDVMRLPATDFQDCHIEMQGEMVILSRGTETHSFSLKKLWVQIEKELRRHLHPATPRELAKLLIHAAVEHHEDLQHLAYSHQGMGWYGYAVSIGGYVKKPGQKKAQSVDCWHIVVDEFDGDDCAFVFDLKEIYQEIERDLKQGFALVQPALF